MSSAADNPIVHVVFDYPQAKFDIIFYKNHLNVDWKMQYEVPDMQVLYLIVTVAMQACVTKYLPYTHKSNNYLCKHVALRNKPTKFTCTYNDYDN